MADVGLATITMRPLASPSWERSGPFNRTSRAPFVSPFSLRARVDVCLISSARDAATKNALEVTDL